MGETAEDAVLREVYEETGVHYEIERLAVMLEKHISLSQAIESVGLLSVTPIKTADGKYVVASEELYFYVTKRLVGEQLKASMMYLEDYMSKARFIGEIIGQLSIALTKVDVA